MYNVLMMLQIISALLLAITLFTHGYFYGDEEVMSVSVCECILKIDLIDLIIDYQTILKLRNKKLEKILPTNHHSTYKIRRCM